MEKPPAKLAGILFFVPRRMRQRQMPVGDESGSRHRIAGRGAPREDSDAGLFNCPLPQHLFLRARKQKGKFSGAAEPRVAPDLLKPCIKLKMPG